MFVIIGVSGCGKTTIGKLLSKKTGIPFYDADNFHSDENISKMKNNIPLSDKDRMPWLETLSVKLVEWEENGGGILACSALKESYREILSSKTTAIFWIYLSGTFEFIEQRLKSRVNHYMKAALLKSQFETLEVPPYGLHINIEDRPENIPNTLLLNL